MSDSKTPADFVRIRVLISGLVQGVGYRYSTVQQARGLGINGWVRNLADGRVEAWFEGNGAVVDRMIQWCYRGPIAARVREVEAIDESNSSEPPMTTFEVQR